MHVCSRLREDPTRMLLTHTEDDSAAELASRGCVLLVLFQKGAITPITVLFHLQLTVIDNPVTDGHPRCHRLLPIADHGCLFLVPRRGPSFAVFVIPSAAHTVTRLLPIADHGCYVCSLFVSRSSPSFAVLFRRTPTSPRRRRTTYKLAPPRATTMQTLNK